LYALVPATVPEGCRASIAEATVRANYGMKLGKFELDFSDGEIRFHLGNVFPPGGFDDDIVRRLIGTTIHVMDRYFPAFMSIIYANELPQDAITLAEQDLKRC
jgi:hypothetical protein